MSVADAVRVVVLEAEGRTFCAGSDVNWMKRAAALGREDNQRDAMQLAVMIDSIDRCPKPVIAVVQGADLGGGVGLVAAADMVVAAEDASFALTEIRLGLEPSVIGPVTIRAMGERACRRYFLTGERFDAREACRLGLVNTVVHPEKLAEARDHWVEACLKGAPGAIAAAKELIRVVADTEAGPDLMRLTAHRLAERRASDEGNEGVMAFLEKRKPGWTP